MGRDRRLRCNDKVVVKYDPRDLSRIFVRLGDAWLMAPTRNPGRPAITLWEQKAASRALRARGRREIDEATIFETIAAQRALVDQATRDTMHSRRSRARRAHLQKPQSTRSPTVPADEPIISLPHFPTEVWE